MAEERDQAQLVELGHGYEVQTNIKKGNNVGLFSIKSGLAFELVKTNNEQILQIDSILED